MRLGFTWQREQRIHHRTDIRVRGLPFGFTAHDQSQNEFRQVAGTPVASILEWVGATYVGALIVIVLGQRTLLAQG